LVIKPYLETMTRSELLSLMVGGMATIAGGVLIAYVSFGAEAGHLLTASVMSAPATLMIAKILMPETETSQTLGHCELPTVSPAVNGIDALCQGSTDGLKLSVNVLAMLITFTAVVALANFVLAWATGWLSNPLTLQQIFGWLNAPFAFLMGIPAQDCVAVGQALGERIVLNEFFGYLTITSMKETLDPRSFAIASYALCGFANFASVAIQIGGIGTLAPSRRKDLAELGLKAMIGGLLACYCTACVAGLLL
jgi:CNT family concentrative nucleoside transporter